MDKHRKERSSSPSCNSVKSTQSVSSNESNKRVRKRKSEPTKRHKRDHSRDSSNESPKQRRSEDYRKSKQPRNDNRNSHDKDDGDKRDKYRDVNRKEKGNCRSGGSNRYKDRDSYQRYGRSDSYRSNSYRNWHRDNGNDDYYRRNAKNNRHRSRKERSRSRSFDHASAKWGKEDKNSKDDQDAKPKKEKEKPNFGLSGKLTEETNTYRGVVIKYSEPPEARKPKRRWRLYPFKGDKSLQTLYIHRESAYLIGRDRKVVDLPIDHPSCSKQHAALQYRLVTFTRDDGTTGKRVRPYLIDLESANGTYINNKKIEAKKYVELLEKDVIKFGFSSREYVLLHENSKDETQDDDVKVEEEEVAVKPEPSN